MPRKVKQKQKQQQKQTVVVNIGTRGKRTKRQAQKTRQLPPAPQFIPYPIPSLRGPEPMVPSQASLIQLIEALKPLHAPVVTHVPAVPPPIHIPGIMDDDKQEIGPLRMVKDDEPLVVPDEALVSAGPSSSSSSSTPYPLTRSDLEAMPISQKDEKPGVISLRRYAKENGIIVPRNISRQKDLIDLILEAQQSQVRRTIPRPRRAPQE